MSNIIDRPNERSSHSSVVLRGGGVIFLIGAWVWSAFYGFPYVVFLAVYGVDAVLTICHRILLHENLGEAHRKHAYQLMANELKLPHPLVSGIYMVLQLAVSLGFVFLCPDSVAAHWAYLIGIVVVLAVAYVLFKRKFYHLHEEYLRELKIKN